MGFGGRAARAAPKVCFTSSGVIAAFPIFPLSSTVAAVIGVSRTVARDPSPTVTALEGPLSPGSSTTNVLTLLQPATRSARRAAPPLRNGLIGREGMISGRARLFVNFHCECRAAHAKNRRGSYHFHGFRRTLGH